MYHFYPEFNAYATHKECSQKFYDSLPKEYREALEFAVKKARTEIGNSMPQLAEKSKKELDFSAQVALRDGLTATIDWTRKNMDLIDRCIQKHAARMAEL